MKNWPFWTPDFKITADSLEKGSHMFHVLSQWSCMGFPYECKQVLTVSFKDMAFLIVKVIIPVWALWYVIGSLEVSL